ncbi:Protein ANTAGONIST OF LIKE HETEROCHROMATIN PROTEIN 1 [Frankliniella fusca]|uniref:Protein ANTAGONIST OF LIKE HETEROCHROMATIN PROTEIN 1 n=1 Tax=Frankliniella fusca TaxID=407009 RepID=A0AAE1HLI3_9NEOP|nr:Protein ANTAGONIST OF LIKE HETEROCHROMATIN PROTEIN 1 [Frankliniella fusca]
MVGVRRRLLHAARALREVLAQRRRDREAGLPVQPLGPRARRLGFVFAALVRQRQLRAARAVRRWRRRPAWTGRDDHGAWVTSINTMLNEDPDVFFDTFRMTPLVFNELLALIRPHIQKRPQTMYLEPGHRLALTLHYLASGNYQKFAGVHFSIPKSTASIVIRETCQALWTELRPLVLPEPTVERLEATMEAFWERWQYPNCIGALDGKHCILQNFHNFREGEWLNYKGTFSMVLLAMCDASYKFTWVHIGGRGRRHDAGLWRETALCQRLENGTFPLPAPRLLPGGMVVTPPAIVADGAFPLTPNLMKPFRQPEIVSDAERIYNYRLSRARRTIENAFGILSSRWRVLRRSYIASVVTSRTIIQACVVLHNYLVLNQENVPPHQYWYIPPNVQDIPGFRDHQLPPAEDQEEDADDAEALPPPVEELQGPRAIREHLVDFFVGPGSVPWQWRYLTE